MDKRLLAILAVIAALFVGIALLTGDNSNKSNPNVQPTSHIRGDNKTKVNLTEYGDFQCVVCERYFPYVEQVYDKYNKKIAFQFRHLPLVAAHPNAFAAARAAEAADMQGKFWEMYKLLYDPTNWQSWTNSRNPVPTFNQYAQKLQLNTEKFKQDYTSTRVNDLINADLSAFKKTGRDMATPTFFLNGKPLSNGDLVDDKTGAPSVEKFSKLIDAEIAQQAKQPKQ